MWEESVYSPMGYARHSKVLSQIDSISHSHNETHQNDWYQSQIFIYYYFSTLIIISTNYITYFKNRISFPCKKSPYSYLQCLVTNFIVLFMISRSECTLTDHLIWWLVFELNYFDMFAGIPTFTSGFLGLSTPKSLLGDIYLVKNSWPYLIFVPLALLT